MHERSIDADKVAQPTTSTRESYESCFVTAIEELLLARRTLEAANCWLHGYMVPDLQAVLVLCFRANLYNCAREFMAEANRHRFTSDGMGCPLRGNETWARVLMKIRTANSNESWGSTDCQQGHSQRKANLSYTLIWCSAHLGSSISSIRRSPAA